MSRTWWVWVALALVACGGDGGTDKGSASGDDDDDIAAGELVCEDTFSPCGGDPVGTWQVVDYCAVSGGDYASTCPDLQVIIVEDRGSGTVTVNADGTYERTYNVDADIEMVIPLSCIAPVPCSLIALGSGGLFTSCTEDTSAQTCSCEGTVVDTNTEAGNWVVDGTDFVADGVRNPFCVKGSTALVEDDYGTRVRWKK